MKLLMLEVYQGTGVQATLLPDGTKVNIMEIGKTYDVDETLGQWLLENHKAEPFTKAEAHYGGQSEPELRHDEEKYPGPMEVTEVQSHKRGRGKQ